MTDRLSLFNGALFEIGERKLASLTEDREPRRVLDQVFDRVVKLALEEGQWNFAERTVRIDSDPSVSLSFGYAYAFTIPDDWVRTTGVGSSEYIDDAPLDRYQDDQTYWYADIDPIYVRYVSNDPSYGLNYGNWSETFTRYVELALADRICERITQNGTKSDRIKKDLTRAKRDALNKDAMRGPTKQRPPGRFVVARGGGFLNRRYDRA